MSRVQVQGMRRGRRPDEPRCERLAARSGVRASLADVEGDDVVRRLAIGRQCAPLVDAWL